MADADEDLVTRPGLGADNDIDLSDETQDFRFLAAIGADGGKIPKRGEKDFEPHATELQSNTLAASRLAMHNALSVERYHAPKNHCVATYHPATNMAYAVNARGVWISKMGQVLPKDKDPFGDDEQRGQRLWLLPEEALYLIERGTIDIRWPEDDEVEPGLPMSLQAAYTMFIGDEVSHDGALTFERFSVYSALRRAGYTVIRAPSWNSVGPPLDETCFPTVQPRSWRAGLNALLSWKWTASVDHDSEPMVGESFFRSYSEIYRRLALIQRYDPTQERYQQQLSRTELPFQVAYYVYKANNTKFRKTAPGLPDFRIAVIDARATNVPTLDQLSRLIETVPYDAPQESAHFYAKLKHGYKNVILAVVDQGVTSYIRLFDAAFGQEKIYDRVSRAPGGKRGGFRGGRGRGRGRGR